jgi:hypothetical protein
MSNVDGFCRAGGFVYSVGHNKNGTGDNLTNGQRKKNGMTAAVRHEFLFYSFGDLHVDKMLSLLLRLS